MRHYRAVTGVLRKTIVKSRLLLTGIIIAVIGTIVIGIIPPLVLEKIVNSLTEKNIIAIDIAILYFSILAVGSLMDGLREVLLTVFGQRVTKELRNSMCRKLTWLQTMFFTQSDSGETASLFVNDVDTVDTLFASGVISMFIDCSKVISILIVIFVKSTGLGILMLLVTPALYMYTRHVQKKMLEAQLDNRVAVGRASNHIPETIQNIRMIHIFKKEKYMSEKYASYINNGYKAMEKTNFYDAVYSPIVILISSVVISVMMMLAAMGGEIQDIFGMSVGTAVAVIAYVGKVFEPLEGIGMEIQNVQSAVAGVRRIEKFLDEPEINKGVMKASMNESAEYTIECLDVSFGYSVENGILNGFNMKVKKGEHITLIGKTGAGKSTIIKLILGLIFPKAGQILICGVEADVISNTEKRRIFGYVEQSFQMVQGTVEEQITLFDPNITHSEVEQAARLAGIHEKILQLKNGYNTICESSLFSQGQWQLLAIARAVVAKPAILLLDEITANLDSETELQVLDALDRAAKGRTVVSVSHRKLLPQSVISRSIVIE